MCLGTLFRKVSDIATSSFSHQAAGQRLFCCFFGWDRNLLRAHGGCWGGREGWLLLCLSLNGGRERDCSVFVFNLATKAFLVSLQFLGRFVSYPHNTVPYQGAVLFLLWGRTTSGRSSWSTEQPQGKLEHRKTTKKPQIQYLPHAVPRWRG